jgi:ketosteroid isomerase-like protein
MHEAELRSWLQAYGRAWETQDGDGFVALFSDDAIYSENPFDEPLVGVAAIRAYARLMERHQRDVSFGFEVVSVTPVVVSWQATYRNVASDERTRLDGVFLLAFNDEGRCTSLREWWHADPGPAFTAADL